MRTPRSSSRALPAALVVSALALLALAGTARAQSTTTLYVAKNHPNCSNSGPGTATQPFCSIGTAASRVTAGQTVQVSQGTYGERVTVSASGTASAPITFTAAPGEDVVVSGGANGFYLSSRSNVIVDGFEIANTSDDGIVVKGSSRITVRGNEVHHVGAPASGMTAKGIRVESSVDSVVTDNTVHHATDYGIYLVGSSRIDVTQNESYANARGYQRAASGIRLHSSSSSTIASNVSHDNEDSGIELVTSSSSNLVVNNVTHRNDDHGIDVSVNCTSVRVIANTVYRSATSGINVEGGSTGATVMNNIAVDNAIGSPRGTGNIRVDSTSTLGTTVDYDLVHVTGGGRNFEWGGLGYNTLAQFRAASGQEAHGIEAPPAWVAPSSGDFRLDAGSPAIDSANSSASGQASTDIAGNPRFDDPGTPNTGAGTRPYDDRGAYERQSGSPPTNAPPDARLTVSPASGDAPLQVTADASGSTDPDGTPIASYRFAWGDGSPATGPQAGATATHTYTAAGTYTVTVTATDEGGLSSEATAQVTVHGATGGNAPPEADLSVAPSSGAVDLQVTADASGSTDADGTIASYRFDFGDGSAVVGPQSGPTATHTYTAAGTYTVTVTVTDDDGATATATAQVVARANLVTNPGFETDLSRWNTSASGPGITLTRVQGGHSGGWAAKLTNTGTSPSTCALNDTPDFARPTTAAPYSAALWVRSDSAGATLKARWTEYVGTTNAGSVTQAVTLSTSWQRVALGYTPTAPGSTLDLNVYIVGAAPGTCFYADDVSIEVG